MFALPKDHKYANKKSLSFSDMNGENMLLMPDIGFWSFVLEKMPDSRFLTQNDRYSFQELVQALLCNRCLRKLPGYRRKPDRDSDFR